MNHKNLIGTLFTLGAVICLCGVLVIGVYQVVGSFL